MLNSEFIKNTNLQRKRWRLINFIMLMIVGSISSVIALLWMVSKYNAWEAFQSDLRTYHGVTIGQKKIDVQYALNTPQTVQGPEIIDENGWTVSSPLRVNPAEANESIPAGYDPLPKGKSANDYDEWHYWNDRGSFDVDFNTKTHRVESIACYSEHPAACDTLFGIGIGTSEEEVLERLGRPDKQETSGGEILMGMPVQVTKTFEYHKLGIRLLLAKKAVTSISKRSPQDVGFWWWATHGRL